VAVLSPSVAGLTAIPHSGSLPCGYQRPIKHQCKDLTCPLNSSLVMVFAPNPARAILACRKLWDARNKPLLLQRFRVIGETFQLSNADTEYGLLENDPRAWTEFRSMVEEQETPAIHLTTLDALVSFVGSPGEMWRPEGLPMPIPPDVGVAKGEFEDESWWPAGAEHPDDLIDGL
jgi:hypothetical protein